MKSILAFALALCASIAFSACDTSQTNDAIDGPVGTTPVEEGNPRTGEEAREQRGDDPNESGHNAAEPYQTQDR